MYRARHHRGAGGRGVCGPQSQLGVGGQMLTIQGLGGEYDELYLPLHGEHQATNAALALAAVELFFDAGDERKLTSMLCVRVSRQSPRRVGRACSYQPTVIIDSRTTPWCSSRHRCSRRLLRLQPTCWRGGGPRWKGCAGHSHRAGTWLRFDRGDTELVSSQHVGRRHCRTRPRCLRRGSRLRKPKPGGGARCGSWFGR